MRDWVWLGKINKEAIIYDENKYVVYWRILKRDICMGYRMYEDMGINAFEMYDPGEAQGPLLLHVDAPRWYFFRVDKVERKSPTYSAITVAKGKVIVRTHLERKPLQEVRLTQAETSRGNDRNQNDESPSRTSLYRLDTGPIFARRRRAARALHCAWAYIWSGSV